MECKACGKEILNPAAKFCRHCGTSVSGTARNPSAKLSANPISSQSNSTVISPTKVELAPGQVPPKPATRATLILLVVIALGTLGGGGAWIWNSKQKADAQVAELKKQADEEVKAHKKLDEETRISKATGNAAIAARTEADAKAAKEAEELKAKLEIEAKAKVEEVEKDSTAKAAITAAPSAPSPAATCPNIGECYNATLLAMSKNDIDTVRRIAEKIDTFDKPARGNRPVARKLNDEGLRAMRQSDFSQAATIFAKAQREDPSDVEIASNLGFARVKAGDLAGASQALGDALLLNPRRTSTWIPIAELLARRYQNVNDAQIALLVAYEWSTAKEKAVDYYTTQANTETHPQLKSAFEEALKRIVR